MSTIQPNFFSSEFFELIARKRPDFPITFEAGTTAGPWTVEKIDDGRDRWAVRLAVGGGPVLTTPHHEVACLFAASLPVRDPVPRYKIESDDDPKWWKLILPWGDAGMARIASLKYDDDEALISAIDTLHALLISPESIAWLLLAAPKETLDQVGALVAERLKELPD